MEFVINAVNFAAIAHQNQRRKNDSKTPYINHPIEVMKLLSDAGVTCPNTLAAAVLHDTIEDCGVTAEDITKNFNQEVTSIVLECSDDKSDTKINRKIHQITHASEISTRAKLVKLADKLSNIGDLDNNPPTIWTSAEIYGYYVWSYAVCNNLNLDIDSGFESAANYLWTRLDNIFRSKGLDNLSASELEKQLELYYSAINHSE